MLGIFLAIIFILLNGFFVAAEFAFVKLSTTLPGKKQGPREDPKVTRARRVVARIDRYLSVTQLGITLASLGLGWIGEPSIERYVARAFHVVLGHAPEGGFHVATVVISFTTLTFGHVLFGELVPKLIAMQRSEAVAFSAATPLHLIFIAFRPLLWILEHATRGILRVMGLSSDAASEGTLTEDEVVGILAANAAHSRIGREKTTLVERVLRFAQRTARHAMVPRVDVFSLPVGTTGEQAIDELRTHQFSRVPLTKGPGVDDVIGYLLAKDFLVNRAASKLTELSSLRRDAMFVPETQSLIDVMRSMQSTQTPMAVVVDEYGGTAGIVTMEDLLEEIVGEIRDELDVEAARVEPAPDETNAWDVDARTPMEELRSIGVHVDDDDDWGEMLGTILLTRLARTPRLHDKVELGPEATAEVTSVSRRRITRARIRWDKSAAEHVNKPPAPPEHAPSSR